MSNNDYTRNKKSASMFNDGDTDGDNNSNSQADTSGLIFRAKLANNKYYHLGWIYSVACDNTPNKYNSFGDDILNSRDIVKIPMNKIKQANRLYNYITKRINQHNYNYFIYQRKVIVHFRKVPYYKNTKYNRKHHCKQLVIQHIQSIYKHYSNTNASTKSNFNKGTNDAENSQDDQEFVNMGLAKNAAYKDGWLSDYILDNLKDFKSKDNPAKPAKKLYYNTYKHNGHVVDEY